MSRRRKRLLVAVAAALTLTGTSLPVTPVAAAPVATSPSASGLGVFVGEVPAERIGVFRAAGLDHEDVSFAAPREGMVAFEAVMTQRTAAALRGQGITATRKQLPPQDPALRATGEGVFRSYSEPGGIARRARPRRARPPRARRARAYRARRARGSRSSRCGSRRTPTRSRTAQHGRPCSTTARSTPGSGSPRRWSAGSCTTFSTATARTRRCTGWSTPASCGSCRWPTPTVTTSPSPRATASGARTCATTTPTAHHHRRRGRPQPQLPDQVGLRQRGLVAGAVGRDLPRTPSGVRAGDPGPGRPRRAGGLRVPRQLPLRGRAAAVRHRLAGEHAVARTTTMYEALAGTDASPAVPGYDPDLSAELYTTNGDTDEHMRRAHRTLGFTPEMSTCQTVSDAVPRRPVARRGLRERLQLPGRRDAHRGGVPQERPVRAVGGPVRRGPREPVSVVGRHAPRTSCSTRSRCRTAVSSRSRFVAKRTVQQLRLHYRVDGGPVRTGVGPGVGRWQRYGDGRRHLLRRVPRDRAGHPARRPGRGVVHRAQGRRGTVRGRRATRRDRVLHLPGGRRHRRARCWCWPPRTSPASRPAQVPPRSRYVRPLRAGAERGGLHLRRLRRRRARPAPPRTRWACCRTTARWSGRPATT